MDLSPETVPESEPMSSVSFMDENSVSLTEEMSLQDSHGWKTVYTRSFTTH